MDLGWFGSEMIACKYYMINDQEYYHDQENIAYQNRLLNSWWIIISLLLIHFLL